ncbi:MAG: class I SAM-dependent methyltransferase [Bryobacteraceae bacterium]|nr:class I SAM-dependent methyltransferase [Bryobacteraceae bacterium]
MTSLRIGTDAEFATVRACLESAGLDEARLCERLGIASLENFEEDFERAEMDDWEADATGVLIQLFVEGHYVDRSVAAARLGAESLTAMFALGLIEGDEMLAATVALYPTAGVWIASDRWNSPDRTPYKTPQDVVYPSIVSNAQRFLRFLPETPCERMLDLCSGTAFAALRGASTFAQKAWAFDISTRATLFAEFNARLNAVSNFEAAAGDLYEPAGGQQFDRIVAHPPYVPVLRPKWVYQDGGEDGEQIVRRCVEGLPDHLAPGGLFYLLAMGSDRRGRPWERRVRSWLGDAGDAFDVGVFVVRTLDPEEFAVRVVVNSETPPDDLRAFRQLFGQLGVKQMVYAVVLVQRRDEERPVFTIRRQNSASTTITEILSAMELETWMQRADAAERLLRSRVRVNPGAELQVRHMLSEEGWQPQEYMLRTSHPFSMEARTETWAPFLLAQCDGGHTVYEHFLGLQVEEVIPEGTSPEDFAQAIQVLISGGLLEVTGAPSDARLPDDSAPHPNS